MRRHLLIIGAQRCGTTYLASRLDAHPEITLARPSRPEPKVFISPELSARGAEWYRHTFFTHATTQQLLADKSTSYLEDPAAAQRAAEVLGDAFVVAQLREPIARAASNWQFSTSHALESRPLTQALRDNLDHPHEWDREFSSVSPFAYLERGRYIDYLEPWLEAFPDSVHVQFLEEVGAGGDAMERLFRWLGVDPDAAPPDDGGRVNASEQPAPAIDDELEGALRTYFSQSDARLAERIGRALPWTGY